MKNIENLDMGVMDKLMNMNLDNKMDDLSKNMNSDKLSEI